MAARAASRSPAATTRRTTTASRWCWPAAPSTARRSSACAGAWRPTTSSSAAAARRRWTSSPSTAPASSPTARLARPMTIAVDCGNGIAGASAPGVLRALGCTVRELYSEVDGDFPNHHPDPSKPENLAELIRARAGRRRRARPRLRRRRRPPRRRHQGRADHLPRSPADAVRARRAQAQARRDDHLRRQVLAAAGAADPRRRRRAADVEDRPLAGQGQDARDRRAARRRDERPHLLRRALVRLRRRHLHGGAAARDRQRERRPERGAERAADELLDARS